MNKNPCENCKFPKKYQNTFAYQSDKLNNYIQKFIKIIFADIFKVEYDDEINYKCPYN